MIEVKLKVNKAKIGFELIGVNSWAKLNQSMGERERVSERESEVQVPSFCLTFRQLRYTALHCTVLETCITVTVSLLSRPQVAPEWWDQYLPTILGRV